MKYDLFISHASEDKKSFVRPLAQALKKFGVKVWYDEFSLKLGDSLSRSIDHGLSQSKFGVVVLSKSFFQKDWPKRELQGLIAREIGVGKVILPIWHNITRKELIKYSPILTDEFALASDGQSIVQTANRIIEVVRPDLSEKIHRRIQWHLQLAKGSTKKIALEKLSLSGPRHDSLPFDLIQRIRLIRIALMEVYPHSMKYWIDGFRGDAHPTREIRIWEHIAACYLEYVVQRTLSKEAKKEVFSVLLSLSIGASEKAPKQKKSFLPAGALSKLKKSWKSDVPIDDIADKAFPLNYEMSQEDLDRMKRQDSESFPYDIPDELVFELLG